MPRKKKQKKLTGERLLERDIIKVLIFFGVLVVLYFIAGMYFRSLNQFTFNGLAFTKEKYGELPVYHYYYYFNDKAGRPVQYNVFLQHDPRTNNISTRGDPVLFEQSQIYITFGDSYPSSCRGSSAAVFDLTLFLSQNKMAVMTGLTNESTAKASEKEFYSCNKQPSSSEVIEFLGGERTEIVVEDNCHRIYVGPECRMQEAIEKFKIESLINARQRNLGA